MERNSDVRWIHISDLHFNDKNNDNQKIREDLLEFLNDSKIECDYVFCTGDVRNAEQSYKGVREYIDKLCKTVNTKNENFFVVPGNHDVDRNSCKRHKTITKISFYNKGHYEGKYNIKNGEIDQNSLRIIQKGLSEFKKFLLEINYPQKCMNEFSNSHYNIETNDFNIIHLDSTLTYTKGQEKKELIIGWKLLEDILSKINSEKPTIVLSHFPITALRYGELRKVIDLLKENQVNLWLCGHEHDNWQTKISDINIIQAGEIREENTTTPSFLIGNYNSILNMGKIELYIWEDKKWQKSNYDSKTINKESYDFVLKTKKGFKIFNPIFQGNYINCIFLGKTPWEEECKIKILNYEKGILEWEWTNYILIDKMVRETKKRTPQTIKERIKTELNEFYIGNFAIEKRIDLSEDKKEFFLYKYIGIIQITSKGIILTFYYGQRISYIKNGGGDENYNYSGGFCHGNNESIFLEKIVCSSED